jgi:hypothetical protein
LDQKTRLDARLLDEPNRDEDGTRGSRKNHLRRRPVEKDGGQHRQDTIYDEKETGEVRENKGTTRNAEPSSETPGDTG